MHKVISLPTVLLLKTLFSDHLYLYPNGQIANCTEALKWSERNKPRKVMTNFPGRRKSKINSPETRNYFDCVRIRDPEQREGLANRKTKIIDNLAALNRNDMSS